MGSCCCKRKAQVTHSISRPENLDDEDDTPLNPQPANVTSKHLSSERLPTRSRRFNKVGISTTNPLLLISGYEKEPIVSLEQSLASLDSHLQFLPDQIKHAKASCRYPNPHGLTHDESAAVYLYSMHGDHKSVHEHLERAWKMNDGSQMKPWFRYLKLLRSALEKLPDAKGETWKGTTHDSNLANTLQSDSLPLYTCMRLCSTSMSELTHALDVKPGSRMILVGYKSVGGKDLTRYTESDSSKVMLWSGARLNRVKTVDVDGYGILTSHLAGRTSKLISTSSATWRFTVLTMAKRVIRRHFWIV